MKEAPSIERLDERDYKIVETLRAHPRGLGVNELYRDCKEAMARPTVRERIAKLKGLGLLDVEEGRQGQRSRITLAEEFNPLAEILSDLEQFEKEVTFCVKVLNYKLDHKLEEAEAVADMFSKLLSDALGVLYLLALTPKPGTPVEVQDYVGLKVLAVARTIFTETFSPSPLQELARQALTGKTFTQARKRLYTLYRQLSDEAEILRIK